MARIEDSYCQTIDPCRAGAVLIEIYRLRGVIQHWHGLTSLRTRSMRVLAIVVNGQFAVIRGIRVLAVKQLRRRLKGETFAPNEGGIILLKHLGGR